MINYAYQVQVRDTEDTEWMDAEMLVSPPGHGPNTLLKIVYEGHENLVRVKRIKQSLDFLINLEREIPVMIYEAEDAVALTFEDRVLDIPRDQLQ